MLQVVQVVLLLSQAVTPQPATALGVPQIYGPETDSERKEAAPFLFNLATLVLPAWVQPSLLQVDPAEPLQAQVEALLSQQALPSLQVSEERFPLVEAKPTEPTRLLGPSRSLGASQQERALPDPSPSLAEMLQAVTLRVARSTSLREPDKGLKREAPSLSTPEMVAPQGQVVSSSFNPAAVVQHQERVEIPPSLGVTVVVTG